MCKCKSYNNIVNGSDNEVILLNPFTNKNVCIDYCIADVIKYLWKNNIRTGGSCCGHNKYNPQIVINDYNINKDYVKKIRNIIKEIDNRYFDILSYELCYNNINGDKKAYY